MRNIKYIVTPQFRQLRKLSNIHFYGQDHAWFSFIGKNKPFTLLEDGLDNYVRAPSTGIKRKLLSYFGTPYLEMGRSDNVYQIQLTGIFPIPEDIKNKVNIVDIKSQWEGLGQEAKNFISHLFMNKVQLSKIANLQCKDSALIITQPLDQDGIISVEQKINYYLDAVSRVEGVKEVWFKRHPRDDTNYDALGWKELGFTDCPIELLSQLGLEFKYVITYNSTAIYRFPKEKRITAVLK
ncbi:glycosyltransferase family 52 [Vibrio mediterranei]|uniref:glycosyltransferase family 52 n=1 Tax=Vibrio mediterranei TaxID=689 RepID=UPI0013EF6A69|nr:glycosyltransferase family 52 [Vibrio mediterranei]